MGVSRRLRAARIAALGLMIAAMPGYAAGTTEGAVPAVSAIARRSLPAKTLPYYAGLTVTVAKHGWACVFVSEDRSKAQVMAYTVGLSSKHLPELLLQTGDDEDAACTMLNQIAKRLIDGRVQPNDGAEPFPRLVRLRKIYSHEFFGQCIFAAVWRDEHHIEGATGMQVVFADEKGVFPPD